MSKTFRAVPVDRDGKELVDRREIILSDSDFDAMRQDQELFGQGVGFDLWKGYRIALRFRPIGP